MAQQINTVSTANGTRYRRSPRVVSLRRQAGEIRMVLATMEARVRRGQMEQRRLDMMVERMEAYTAEADRLEQQS